MGASMPPFDDRGRSPFDRPSFPREDRELKQITKFLERLLAAQKKISAILDIIDVQKEKHPLAGEHPTPETKAEMRAILQRLMELQNLIQELETELTKAEEEAIQKQKEEEEATLTADPLRDEPVLRRRPPFRRRPDFEPEGMFPERDRLDEPSYPTRLRPRNAAPSLVPDPVAEEKAALPREKEPPVLNEQAAAASVESVVLSSEPAIPEKQETIVEPATTDSMVVNTAAPLSDEAMKEARALLEQYEKTYRDYRAQWDPIFNDPQTGAAQKMAHPEVVQYMEQMETYLAEQKKRVGI